MATFPNTQDITQYLGSSIGKPVNFDPTKQAQIPGMPQTNPQQNQPMAPSPYMPSSGPYNPYQAQQPSGGNNLQGFFSKIPQMVGGGQGAQGLMQGLFSGGGVSNLIKNPVSAFGNMSPLGALAKPAANLFHKWFK